MRCPRLSEDAIGAISGTSMDGIDVSIVETDGDTVVRPGPGRTYAYDPRFARADCCGAARRSGSVAEKDPLAELEARGHAMRMPTPSWRSCATSASTAPRSTWSGCTARPSFTGRSAASRASSATARAWPRASASTSINRFRHADVAAGGEGAPFAPLYHRALAASLPQPVMVLNLGGVGNVTYIDADTVIAFDTGPASALLDDFVPEAARQELRRGRTAGGIGRRRTRRS